MMDTQSAIKKTALKKAPRISARTQPKVNSSVVAFCDAITAHRPMAREIISFSMWKASAVSANECARKPDISSSRKKAVSMAIMILMRVLLDHAMLEVFGMANRNAAPNWRAWTCEESASDDRNSKRSKRGRRDVCSRRDDGGRENLR